MDARYLPSLQRLYQNETQLERQLVLMTVLKQSPAGTLKEVVRSQNIVQELQKWLQSAVESKELRLAFRVMESLDKLPIDLTVLQVSQDHGFPLLAMHPLNSCTAASFIRRLI